MGLNWLPAWLRLFVEWASGIAAWLGGFELLKLFFEGSTARSLAAQLYVVATALALAGVLAIREWSTSRKEKYANITNYLQQAGHAVRDLQTIMVERRPPDTADIAQFEDFFEVCKTKFSQVLDQLTLVFVSLTGTTCRTSIKLTYPVAAETYYYTLVRDQGASQKCTEMDNRRVEQNHDPLKKNRQFLLLFDDNNSTWHYFSNNISKDKNFTSTSFTAYDSTWGETGTGDQGFLSRRKQDWPLPYRSTIACAVRQGPGPFMTAKKSTVLGFLTVDSESRGVFVERWDVPLMFSIADALFHPLQTYLRIQNDVNRRVLATNRKHVGTEP